MKIESLTPADLSLSEGKLTNIHKCDTLSESASSAADTFRITDIKQAVKNPNRANIFVGGKYSFSLDITQLSDTKLKIHQTLTVAELSDLHHLSYFGKLYTRTLEWVLTRPRSIKETRDYLRRKTFGLAKTGDPERAVLGGDREGAPMEGFRPTWGGTLSTGPETPTTTSQFSPDTIIEKLIKKGYLDDTKFANYLIENYHTKKGASQKRLILELRKHGISPADATTALSASQRDDQSELRKIIAKKSPKYPDPQKLTAYLLRQGFAYTDIREALG